MSRNPRRAFRRRPTTERQTPGELDGVTAFRVQADPATAERFESRVVELVTDGAALSTAERQAYAEWCAGTLGKPQQFGD